MSDTDDDRSAPPRTDGSPPALSRPLEDELRDPFGPVGPSGPPRRAPGTPVAPPAPARSLIGRSADTSALFDAPATPARPPVPPPPAVPLADAGPAGPAGPPASTSGGGAAPLVPPPSPSAVDPAPAGSPDTPAAGPPVVPLPPLGEDPFTPPGPPPGPLGSSAEIGASSLFSPPAVTGPPAPPPPPVPVVAGPTPEPPRAGWPPPAGWPADASWPPTGPPPAGPTFPFAPPDPPASRGIGPWTVAALAVAVLVVVASVVVGLSTLRGGSTDTAETVERTYPSAWDTRVAPIAEWVADERDLAFEHPVEVVFQPEDEYREQAAGDPTDLDEEEQQDMDDLVATLRALGLVDGEVDLAEATSDLASEGTLAYYDPATEVVHVRGDELTPAVRVTVAHELTHVLQDQHFDLERLGDPDFDRYEGLRAMAEGDAGRIEEAYVTEVLTTEERTAYEDETEASIDGSEEVLGDVPPVLSILFGAPYALGEGFLAYREGAEGGRPWDAVLEDPPSQEELLDPSVWETPRAEEVPVEVEPPEGADVLQEDSFDPLSWYLLLASRGDPVEALRVVDGWGGDAYVAYREDGDVCTAMAVTGDDPAATDALHEALVAWAEADPTGTAEVERVADAVEVRACDPGVEEGTTGEVSEDLLVVPVVRAQLAGQVLAGGGTEEQAECTGWAVVEALTLDQLAASTIDAATEQQITEAIRGCV